MQAFIVTIERMERRKVRVAATSPEHALESLRGVLPDGARALSADPVGLPSPAEASKLLDSILQRDFLDLAGLKDAPIEAWVSAASLPEKRDDLNQTLALAGLRVAHDRDGMLWLWIGSAVSVPWLADHMARLGKSPSMLLPAMQAIIGATTPRGMTFAGIKSRAVGLPLASVAGE